MMPGKKERSSFRFASPPGWRGRNLSALLLVAVCCAGSPAYAQEPFSNPGDAGAEDDVERDVRHAVSAAFAAYKVGDLRAARLHFQIAWKLRPSRAIAQGLAQVEMEMHLYVDAAEHWQYVLERTEDEEQRAAVEAKLTECLQRVGRLRVELNVSGSTLHVDGREFRDLSTSEELLVTAGYNWLTIERPGYQPYREEFSVKPGETLELYILLERSAPSPGEAADPIQAPAEPESDSARTLTLVGGATLTTAAIVAGALFRWQASEELRNADVLRDITRREGDPEFAAHHGQCLPDAPSRPDACDALSRSVDRGVKNQKQANVAFVTAGVLGAATVATWLLWPSSAARSTEERPSEEYGVRWSLSPYGAPHAQGVVFSGRF